LIHYYIYLDNFASWRSRRASLRIDVLPCYWRGIKRDVQLIATDLMRTRCAFATQHSALRRAEKLWFMCDIRTISKRSNELRANYQSSLQQEAGSDFPSIAIYRLYATMITR